MTQLASLTLGNAAFTIRRAACDDIPAIVTLLNDDEIGAARELVPDTDLAPYRLAFDAIDADPNQLLLVAVAPGPSPRPAAGALIWPSSPATNAAPARTASTSGSASAR